MGHLKPTDAGIRNPILTFPIFEQDDTTEKIMMKRKNSFIAVYIFFIKNEFLS
jgi:hypothetical protein